MSVRLPLLSAFRKNLRPWALAIMVHGGLGLFTTLMVLAAEPVPPGEPAQGSNAQASATLPAGEGDQPGNGQSQIELSNPKDMAEALRIIKRAQDALSRVDHYTCKFIKREVLAGKMQPEHTIEMSVRHEPFSVAMKWQKPRNLGGQEGIWVDGKHGGRMRVKGAGLLGAVGFLSLELNDKRVASTSRHAITEAGIANIVKRVAKDWVDFEPHELDQVVMEDVVFDDRPCRRVSITHPREEMKQFEFAKAVIIFDKEHHLPIAIDCYGWPDQAGEDPHLLESYQYFGLKLNPGLDQGIFER